LPIDFRDFDIFAISPADDAFDGAIFFRYCLRFRRCSFSLPIFFRRFPFHAATPDYFSLIFADFQPPLSFRVIALRHFAIYSLSPSFSPRFFAIAAAIAAIFDYFF
jgi:hypothetical protein